MKNLRIASLIAGVFTATLGSAAVAATVEYAQQHAENAASSTETAVEETKGYLSDAALTTKVKSTILASDALNVIEVNVETSNGIVQLSGFVKQEEDIDTAERISRGIEGVKDVKNDIKVKTEAS
ncbi:BON domain-containing protein [Pseudidiomarina sp. 1ASP75-14]|uniref:BON domain-containing protein n=1 Tax=Pseudidiomarina terrestris TaxID=2820060 RepID=UPI0026558368|nr:BON domain-containing protein [Pseudidiomarina sp. 1ASP75-14]MDN7138581.1 BON domain-containing protein [Pseudidiomarina sp. 1ASP75-14]